VFQPEPGGDPGVGLVLSQPRRHRPLTDRQRAEV
jgi:hypothetical protein